MSGSHRPDAWPIEKQQRLAFLPKVVPFWLADRWMRRQTQGESAREAYLARMVFEVMWLSAGHLKHYFDHSGVEHIDQNETYVLTSLHFGHWAMYSASLNQQFGIANQMVATGRNIDLKHPMGHYWYHFGHTRQDLSGYPACYSTDSIFAHLRRLREGISLVVVADVREGDFYQKEVNVRFLGERLYLQRTPALLARRAGCASCPISAGSTSRRYATRCNGSNRSSPWTTTSRRYNGWPTFGSPYSTPIDTSTSTFGRPIPGRWCASKGRRRERISLSGAPDRCRCRGFSDQTQ